MNMDPGARIAFLHSLNQAIKDVQITERGEACRKMLHVVTESLLEASKKLNVLVDDESDHEVRLLFLGGALGLLEAAKMFHRASCELEGENESG